MPISNLITALSCVVQNAARLDSEIIYNRDFDYDYFGFKVHAARRKQDFMLLYRSCACSVKLSHAIPEHLNESLGISADLRCPHMILVIVLCTLAFQSQHHLLHLLCTVVSAQQSRPTMLTQSAPMPAADAGEVIPAARQWQGGGTATAHAHARGSGHPQNQY